MNVPVRELFMVMAVQIALAVSICPHGPAYIDECENECICNVEAGGYGCTRMACQGNATAEKPMYCEVDGEIRVESTRRLFCEGNIVKFEPKKRICDGSPECPADCGQEWDETAGCYNCKCGPDLEFGDVTVAAEQPCPAGLVEGPNHLFQKVCKAQGCQPGATWTDSRGCSTCVCTEDGEPACTPCKREASESTRTCEGGDLTCPLDDCGQVYEPEEDCYQCPCGVGEEGDVAAQFGEPCPPGTDFRTAGAFFKTCAPFDKLPQGDTKFCGEEYREECPADCGLVRVGENEGCIFCQCGPELKAGDVEVAIDEECPGNLAEGPSALATKACRQPTRHSCKPGTTFNEECDICLCQEDGTAACTKRDCSLEKYGDVRSCGEYRECPADCGQVGSDSYCTYCQCGPRLEPGEVTIAAEEPCPPGLKEKEYQAFTKTCTPSGCLYGQKYIDECRNDCQCVGEIYGCTRKACRPGQTAMKPLACDGARSLPKRSGQRVECHEGIVKVQKLDQPCLEGSSFMDKEYCNECFCGPDGQGACTEKACLKLSWE